MEDHMTGYSNEAVISSTANSSQSWCMEDGGGGLGVSVKWKCVTALTQLVNMLQLRF